jgi:hypothetical protein
MGSNGTRLAVVALAVGAAVVLFIVLSGGDDEPSSTTAATNTTQTTTKEERPEKPKPKPKPEPEVPAIVVRGGEPVGGVQKLEFQSGDRVRFVVRSDQAAVFHLHGYDVEQSVPANGRTEFDLPADIEGVFELEDHETLAQIAEVSVVPG